VLLLAVPSHPAPSWSQGVRPSLPSRQVQLPRKLMTNGPLETPILSDLLGTSRSVPFLRCQNHVVRPANLESHHSHVTSISLGTARNSGRADFAVAGNSTQESTTARGSQEN
jgi:hypothetical protein